MLHVLMGKVPYDIYRVKICNVGDLVWGLKVHTAQLIQMDVDLT